MSTKVPLEEVLELRETHRDELAQARSYMASMARRIREEPWSEEFTDELEHNILPDLSDKLTLARSARNSWIRQRRRLLYKVGGVAMGVAAITVGLVVSPVPLLSVAIAVPALGLGTQLLSGLDLVQEWSAGRTAAAENGLHYFLRMPGSGR
jgi:hypothetical protein